MCVCVRASSCPSVRGISVLMRITASMFHFKYPPPGYLPADDRLVGLVVKASASRAEGPGFESRLRRDFFGVVSYQ